MPLTAKGETIKAALQKEYGTEKGERVLYAGKNKGTFKGIDDDEAGAILDAVKTICDGITRLHMRMDARCARMDAESFSTPLFNADEHMRLHAKAKTLRADEGARPNMNEFAKLADAGKAKRDMTPEDWKGIEKFISEEKREPEHKE